MRIRPVEEVVPDYTAQGDQIVNDIAKACQSLMGTTDNILALQRKDLPTAEANLRMFWETEEARPLTIDNTKKQWYPLLRQLYKWFPIIDAALFLYPAQKFVANKLGINSSFEGDAAFIGTIIEWITSAVVAMGLGYLLTLAMRALKGKEKNDPKVSSKKRKYAWLLLLVIPAVYIISQLFVAPTDIDGWLVTLVFAIISLALQMVLFYTYEDQLDALAYEKAEKKEDELQKAIESIEKSIESQLRTFASQVGDLRERFMSLQRFIERKSYEHNLGDLDLYIGNLVAFQRIDICPPATASITFSELYHSMPEDNRNKIDQFLIVYGMLRNGADARNEVQAYEHEFGSNRTLELPSLNGREREAQPNAPIDIEDFEIES